MDDLSRRERRDDARTVPTFDKNGPAESRDRNRNDTAREGRRHRRHSHGEDQPSLRSRHREGGRESDRSGRRERGRDGDYERGHERDHDRDRRRREDRDRREPREHDDSRGRHHRHKHPKRDGDDRVTSSKSGRESAAPLVDGPIYQKDIRGDQLVFKYGSTDRGKVPAYRRFRHGRVVLGTPGRFVFRYDGPREVFSPETREDGGRGSRSIFREKNNPLLLRLAARSAKQPTPGDKPKAKEPKDKDAKDAKQAGEEDDFVPLGPVRKRKRGSDGGSGSDSADSSSSDDASSSSDLADDDFVDDTTATKTIQQNLGRLSRHVHDYPQDVDAWLALVALQDQKRLLLGNEDASLAGRFGDIPLPTQDEVTGLAKTKLGLLDTALRHARTAADRDRLRLARMREGAKVWSPKELARKWKELAEDAASSPNDTSPDHPAGRLSFALWQARLDFELTSLSTFKLDGVKLLVADRLRVLEGLLASPSPGSTETQVDLCSEMVYVFLRTTRFLHEAGFADLATAAWQALLESVFARPADGHASPLQAFWDSEVPRIGEEGAQGWAHYAAQIAGSGDAEDAALLDLDGVRQELPTVDFSSLRLGHHHLSTGLDHSLGPLDDIDESVPLYESWASVEQSRARLAQMPARIVDDIVDDGYEDVFRVVVFSDIEPLLFSLPSSLRPQLQPLLVDAFLIFCRLAPAFATSSWITDIAANDPFLSALNIDPPDLTKTEEESSDGSETASARRPPDLAFDGSPVSPTPEMLFAQPSWFHSLPNWLYSSPHAASSTNPAPPSLIPPTFVANTLRQLVRSFGVEGLAPYSLAVDAAVQTDDGQLKKNARSLIKQYRTNLLLYNSYALAELSRGHVDVARNVLASAVAAVEAVRGQATSDASSQANIEADLALRQTWAWLELQDGCANEALRRLLPLSHTNASTPTNAAPSDDSVTPTQLLQARSTIRTGMDYSLSAGRIDQAALYAQSFVLLEYLAATVDASASTSASTPAPRRGNVTAALAATTVFSDEMQARGHGQAPAHERVLLWTARVVYHYATNGPYRPADLQTPLRRCIDIFPRNGVFLRLFAWVDPAAASGLSWLRPDDPVRQVLGTVALAPANDCPSSRVFSLKHAAQTGNVNAALAALERAVSMTPPTPPPTLNIDPTAAAAAAAATTPPTPHNFHNSQLWKAYVHLAASEAANALKQADASTSKKTREATKQLVAAAKDVFYRAVRACPGSKEVLLEAFGAGLTGPQGMSPSELRSVFQTMVTEGLRVHIDLTTVRERARMWAEEKQEAERQRDKERQQREAGRWSGGERLGEKDRRDRRDRKEAKRNDAWDRRDRPRGW